MLGILSLLSINVIVAHLCLPGPVKCSEPEHKRLTDNIPRFSGGSVSRYGKRKFVKSYGSLHAR